MQHILIAVLQKIIKADLIDFKKAKKRDQRVEKDRQKQNKEVLRRMKYQDQKGQEAVDEDDEDDYFDEKGYNPEKVWKNKNIPGLKDLGEVLYVVEVDWTEFHDILQSFLEETEEKHEEIDDDKTVLDDLIKKYEKENPKWRLKDELEKVYENQGVDSVEETTFQFYQLPADQYGKADVGPSSNLLDPDESDIEEAIERSFQYMTPKNYMVIYSDDKFKYKKLVNELKKERERLNEDPFS